EVPGAPQHFHQKVSCKVCTLPTSTTPHSNERSSAARFLVVPLRGSAKLRQTTTASPVAARRTARARRARYAGSAPSRMFDRENASNEPAADDSSQDAASDMTN